MFRSSFERTTHRNTRTRSLRFPKVGILLQSSLEADVPVLERRQRHIRLAGIALHLRLRCGETGRIVEEVLEHFLAKLHVGDGTLRGTEEMKVG